MKRLLTYLFLFVWVMMVGAQDIKNCVDVVTESSLLIPVQTQYIASLQLLTQEFGLVLSGGGALGLAHIGAIKALEEAGIEPAWVAGSSMGAIIGVMYAAGYSADEIMQIVKDERLYKVGRLIRLQSALRNSGMSTHKTLLHELHELIPHNSFDSLERRFMVCVTDVERGEPVYRYEGANLAEYVAASASIPGLFEPVVIDSVRYVDGGVTDNLPAKSLRSIVDSQQSNPSVLRTAPLRQGSNIGQSIVNSQQSGDDNFIAEGSKTVGSQFSIIAVDVLPFIENYEAKNAIDMAQWALRLFQIKNMDANRDACDVLVQSFALEKYHEFDFKHYKEIYQYGYDAMKAKLQSINN